MYFSPGNHIFIVHGESIFLCIQEYDDLVEKQKDLETKIEELEKNPQRFASCCLCKSIQILSKANYII